LVASSTVGVAATGLAFGRPQLSPPARPPSSKRKATEYDKENRLFSSPSRPATSSTMSTPLRERAIGSSPAPNLIPSEPRLPSAENSTNDIRTGHIGLNTSATRRTEAVPSQDYNGEGRKDSMSSRGSWIRRLSTIQVSQHGSPRSSVGPDSPSFTFSHGSAAPILPTVGSPAQSLPPNKLVKRTISGRVPNGELVGNSTRSQVPTLRRPATSHQRSVTLQRQFRRGGIELMEASPKQREVSGQVPQEALDYSSSDNHTYWRPYFESRSTKLVKERPSGRASDASIDTMYPTSRRILIPEEFTPPTLMKPDLIIESRSTLPHWRESFLPTDTEIEDILNSADQAHKLQARDGEEEKHKRLRRSFSMHLSSPANWMSRSGSLRGPKGGNGRNNGKRYVSDPISLPGRATISAHGMSTTRRKGIMDPTIYQNQTPESRQDETPQHSFAAQGSRSGNTSSPLPPLSRLSSFNLDLGRMVSSSSSSGPMQSPVSPVSPDTLASLSLGIAPDKSLARPSPHVIIHQQHRPHRLSEVAGSDRASTLVGSDSENRGFISSEDEMDFPSDTAFDSFRTGATGSLRARNPPLELMFDESPPNTGGKAKPSMIIDIAANAAFRDTNDRIVEEDESMMTPIRDRRSPDRDRFTPTRTTSKASSENVTRSSPANYNVPTKGFTNLSLEEDEDEEEDEEDWTRDDENIALGNPLSPPSSLIKSRRLGPFIRPVLADVTKTGSSSGNSGPSDCRPKSVFDWSEPLIAETTDIMGNSPRPKTVHGKRIIDSRGGRTMGRKGPTAHHIRSQSVPAVPDVANHREHTTLAPKFGTWGLGAKGISEDWDNDFEFDNVGPDDGENGESNMSNSTMLVPPAIQASQANVVGHVGQIREVCLLVEDLKRLRGLAREKGILNGSSASLWREAEGIIALAIPDEEDQTLSPPRSPLSNTFDYETVDERYRDGGFDIEELSSPRASGHSTNTRSNGRAYDVYTARRRSVFSPEDDIFGTGGSTITPRLDVEKVQSTHYPHQPNKNSTDVARSVMEHIHQHRAISDPLCDIQTELPKKMPFDTTSLRDLVHRASTLSRTLAEIIRKADALTQSPNRSRQDDRDSSPAFTRVFADPPVSPSKNIQRSQSNNSMLDSSIDVSPTGVMGQRMHMMAVV
jgi:Septation protein etd1